MQKQQINVAMALLQKGDTAEALALARRLSQQWPADIEIRQVLAISLARSGDIVAAEHEFRHALRSAPHHPGILSNLATLLRGAGRPLDAIPLSQQATRAHPGFVQGWIDLGAAQLAAGQPVQAAIAFQRAIELKPSPLAWHYLGNARRASGELEAAVIAFRNAIALDPAYAIAWVNLGALSRLLGNARDAIACYERAGTLGYRGPELMDALTGALADDGRLDEALVQARHVAATQPAYAPGLRTLAGLLWEYGTATRPDEDPFALFEQAANAQPANGALQLAHIGFLLEAGKPHAALERLESVRARHDSPQLARMHAEAFDQAGESAKAAAIYAALYRNGERTLAFLNAHARHLLATGHAPEAAGRASEVLQQDPWNQQALAYLATAWRLQGDEREFWLCDYERLVTTVEVEPPPSFAGMPDFLDALGTTLDTLHRAAREPLSQSVRGGSQTAGQLFGRADPLLDATRKALQHAAERWLDSLPPDPTHPFLQRNGRRTRFSGSWSVKLWSAGRHANHIHSEGWISSAFYVQLPPSVRTSSDTQAGCLQLGQPPVELGLDLPPRRILRPTPGKLALFPSYLWHGTVPFDDAEPRVTIAFDLVPAARIA